MSRRTRRVSELLQAEISQLLLRSVQDPRVRMTSVAAVDVSPDLRRAVVRVSVLDEEQREESLQALRHAAGFLRRQLAHRLRHMRAMPELIFEIDRGAEHSQRISDLLERLHDHNESA
jgi:ribosome-binding factor A